MADDSFSIDNMNISKLKVPELKRELKSRGLNAMGNKNELIERLSEAIKSGKNDDGSADSVDELIDEDDVLNDDEIEQEVDDMKNIELEVSDKSFEADTNSNSTKPIKRKNFEISVDIPAKEKSAKKIVLNRKSSTDVHIEEKDVETTSSTNGSADEKKVVKLSELSAKERLEMRAKKFGVPLSTDAKKEVRAHRFGQNSATSTTGKATITLGSSSSITATTATPNLDLLKKRAERFGTVSTQLLKVESAEKLEKRKARFGAETEKANGSTITAPTTTATDPQKAKRLDRFKITLK